MSLVSFCTACTFAGCSTTSCNNSSSESWTNLKLCIVLRRSVIQEMRPWLTFNSLWITTTTFQSQLCSYMVTGMACSHKYNDLLGFKLCSFYVLSERLWCTRHTEHPGCRNREFPTNGYNVQYWLVVSVCLVFSDTAIMITRTTPSSFLVLLELIPYRSAWHLLDALPVLRRLRWESHGYAALRYTDSEGKLS